MLKRFLKKTSSERIQLHFDEPNNRAIDNSKRHLKKIIKKRCDSCIFLGLKFLLTHMSPLSPSVSLIRSNVITPLISFITNVLKCPLKKFSYIHTHQMAEWLKINNRNRFLAMHSQQHWFFEAPCECSWYAQTGTHAFGIGWKALHPGADLFLSWNFLNPPPLYRPPG